MENNINNNNLDINSASFNKNFVSALLKLGFKQSKKATKIFALNMVKQLDQSTVKMSPSEAETLSKLIQCSTFTIYEGEYGFRVNMTYSYDGYKNNIWANIYDEEWQRDNFLAHTITDEEKKRLAVIFYEKPNDFSFAVVMMNDEITNLDDVAAKLNLI